MKLWEKLSYDFKCGKHGRFMEWKITEGGKIQLFIDDQEIDMEAEA